MSEPTLDRSIEEQFAELLDPFKQMLRLVRGKRLSAEAELERLKGEERRIVRGIRAIEPTFEQNGKSGPKPRSSYPLSEQRVTAAREWFEKHREMLLERFPEGATSADYRRLPEWDLGWGADAFLAACKTLHERGVLRLDHRGKGGAKHYAVV